MSQQRIEDFLTKQLFISKNIVTYRLLSRELGVHVNVAKNELAAFYTKVTKSPDQSCSATYLISGEYKFPFPYDPEDTDTGSKRKKRENGWSLDLNMDSDSSPYDFTQSQSQSQSRLKPQESVDVDGRKKDNGDIIAQIRLTVVGEAGLQDAKTKYTKVNSVTLYSLSPAPVRDADLLCEPSRKIREIDNQKGMEFAKTVGRIIGKGIEMKGGITKLRGRTTVATTSSAKPALAVPKVKVEPGVSASAAATAATKVEEKGKEPANDEPKLKARQTRKLDFFVPKPQSQPKEKEIKGSKGKMFFGANDSPKLASSVKEKTPMLTPAPSLPSEEKIEPLKRGAKRKSDIADPSDERKLIKSTSAATAPSRALSRQSSNSPSMRSDLRATKAMSKLRLCKNAIISDEDDVLPQKKAAKRSRRQVTHVSEDEDNNSSRDSVRALKSMMDMDDDQVEKAPRQPKRRLEEEEELEQEALEAADQDGDVKMSDIMKAKSKPRPRKKKEKVVPVGQNGLKKRCIMKSRMRVDERGYMVTEDYSSYESVEEEEEEPEKIVSTNKGGGKRTIGTKKDYSTMKSVPLEDTAVNLTSNSETRFQTTANVVVSSARAASSRSKAGQKQKTLNTFFGVPKPQK